MVLLGYPPSALSSPEVRRAWSQGEIPAQQACNTKNFPDRTFSQVQTQQRVDLPKKIENSKLGVYCQQPASTGQGDVRGLSGVFNPQVDLTMEPLSKHVAH